MKKVLTLMLGVALALAWSGAANAQAASTEKKAAPAAKKKSSGASKHVIYAPSDIKWGDAPPSLPAGAKMAVIEGDPGKSGPYTLRLKTPDGYKVQAHWHPMTEHVTIISGTCYLGTGDKLDESKGTALAAGAYASMPAKMHHFVWTKGETELQVHGMGPFKLVYVNPADDPSKKKM